MNYIYYIESPGLENRRGKLLLFKYFMCMIFCLHVYLHIAGGAHGDQKMALDSLELVLQTIVSHHVGTGNPTQSLCKSNNCS